MENRGRTRIGQILNAYTLFFAAVSLRVITYRYVLLLLLVSLSVTSVFTRCKKFRRFYYYVIVVISYILYKLYYYVCVYNNNNIHMKMRVALFGLWVLAEQ